MVRTDQSGEALEDGGAVPPLDDGVVDDVVVVGVEGVVEVGPVLATVTPVVEEANDGATATGG